MVLENHCGNGYNYVIYIYGGLFVGMVSLWTMGMTRKERFIVAVQAAAIVRDIRDGRTVAGAVVANAFDISERSINGADLSLADMVDEFIRYQYQTGPIPLIPQPDWLMTEDEVKLWELE